jgi:preprotein translocase subunit YajC
MNIPAFLLMAPAGNGGGGLMSLLPIILIFGVMYFFMIRPQMKKAKQQKQYREAIKKGDRIVTIGGIHGKIVDVQETTLIIEVEGGNRLRIEKNAVSMEATATLGDQPK